MSESTPSYRLLRRVALGALTVSDSLEKWGAATRLEAGRFLSQVMRPEEREQLSLERYSASAWAPAAQRGLRAWESDWFKRELPHAPAHLLVAGCGTGREVLPLLKDGYQITAFDGAPGPLKVAQELCANRAVVAEGSGGGALAPLLGKKFDAIILGWGSLTHVAGVKERGRVLRACSALTGGPLLTSFYSLELGEMKTHDTKWATRLGRTLGRNLRALDVGPSVVEFSDWGGFAEYLTREELAQHGAALGRDVDWNEGGDIPFPFVTLRPRKKQS
jgi:SAM-dependent methyltransferase